MTDGKRAGVAHRATDIAFALTFLVACAGALVIAGSLIFVTSIAVPGIGLAAFIVGLALMFEFGVRRARAQGRDPVASLRSGLTLLRGWAARMAGVGRNR